MSIYGIFNQKEVSSRENQVKAESNIPGLPVQTAQVYPGPLSAHTLLHVFPERGANNKPNLFFQTAYFKYCHRKITGSATNTSISVRNGRPRREPGARRQGQGHSKVIQLRGALPVLLHPYFCPLRGPQQNPCSEPLEGFCIVKTIAR